MFTIKSLKQPLTTSLQAAAGDAHVAVTSAQDADHPSHGAQPVWDLGNSAVYGVGSGSSLRLHSHGPRKLELLAPAKNLEVGTAALLAGADAIYIGGSGFGARAAAGNDLNDIAQLCALAHRFGARVYLTVNTLLYNQELPAVRKMIQDAVNAGVDALIVQDPAILTFHEVQNLELHASTQWNINTLAKVNYCAQLGLSQIVVPREFSVEQIRAFCQARPDLRFEVFVSGAMCVSVSGECFISEYMTKRSANRGECAQICRLPMELYHETKVRVGQKGAPVGTGVLDSGVLDTGVLDTSVSDTGALGTGAEPELVAQGHLLSMKDNLRLEQLLRLVEAGACSFKIEGRLKDRDYVVNQVAAFRERLDIIIEQYPELYARSSLGNIERKFTPDLNKTFNRGFTHAYLDGDNSNLVEPRTPKSFGQSLGKMRWVAHVESGGSSKGKFASKGGRQGSARAKAKSKAPASAAPVLELKLNQNTQLANGDSFTYFNQQGELKGFRVNRVAANLQGAADGAVLPVRKGEVVYLFLAQPLSDLANGSELYRNVDTTFIKQLEQPKAVQRKVPLQATVELGALEPSQSKRARCVITFQDAYGRRGSAEHVFELTEQAPLSSSTMQDKLGKLGDDYLTLESCTFLGESSLATFPISVFNQWRREALASYVTYVQLSRSQLQALGHLVKAAAGTAAQSSHDSGELGDLGGVDKASDLKLKVAGTELSGEQVQNLVQQLQQHMAQAAHPALAVENAVLEQAAAEHASVVQAAGQAAAQAAGQTAGGAGAVKAQPNPIFMSIPYLDTTVDDKVYHKPQVWPQWPENYVDRRLVLNERSQQVLAASRSEPLAEPRRLIAQAVMTCRTCLIKNHAVCHKHGGRTTGFYLVIGGQRFDLVTDCKRCLMYVVPHQARQ